jgi:hypothetical protein
MTDSEILSQLINGEAAMPGESGFVPLGPGAADRFLVAVAGGIPQTIDELDRQESRTYDLSVTAALQLNIPVVGSVSGGFNRRVVVLERKAYKELTEGETKLHYGYAIRLGITVSKLTADTKISLPFLAASAEIGNIEAKWVLQVIGLAGTKIDEVSIVPTELSVETFVLAKQSLANLIGAVRDASTRFTAELIEVIKPGDAIEGELLAATGKAFALGRLERGLTRRQALNDLGSSRDEIKEAVVDIYRDFAGITSDTDAPSPEVRSKALSLLGPVKVTPR